MDADAERLLDLIGDVHGLLELEEFRHGLMAALRRAVPADWASINEVGPEPGDHWELVEPRLPASAHETFGRLMHQNPLIAHMTSGPRPGAPLRLSDVCSRREFQALQIYDELYGPLGLEHQLAFTLPQEPPRLLGVALSRRHADFTDAERDLLARARPFLIQGYRNAVAFERERERGRDAAGMLAALQGCGLTPREAESLALVARGASSAAAAARLGVGARTVDKHLQHAFAKLGVSSRSAAAARAWELAE
ncbi:MAG TPA: LuxR C-terminal-related transcriptional regulator [Solirubrobacterales bacterium]|jgi:DNA-binding CsgD family transcriptional regulator